MDSAKNQVSGRFWTVLQVYLTPGNNPYIPGKFSISPCRFQRPEVPRPRGLGALFDSCSTLFDSCSTRVGVEMESERKL